MGFRPLNRCSNRWLRSWVLCRSFGLFAWNRLWRCGQYSGGHRSLHARFHQFFIAIANRLFGLFMATKCYGVSLSKNLVWSLRLQLEKISTVRRRRSKSLNPSTLVGGGSVNSQFATLRQTRCTIVIFGRWVIKLQKILNMGCKITRPSISVRA